MKCSCGGEMELGFIPDFGMFATWTTVWLPGEATTQKSVLDRLRTGAGVSTEVGEARMLEAHRCGSCGLVQLFALKQAPLGATPVVSDTSSRTA